VPDLSGIFFPASGALDCRHGVLHWVCQQNPDRFWFCGSCSSPLERHAATGREVRKTITMPFCDLAGSTALGGHQSPE
jgi:hypothetical protein